MNIYLPKWFPFAFPLEVCSLSVTLKSSVMIYPGFHFFHHILTRVCVRLLYPLVTEKMREGRSAEQKRLHQSKREQRVRGHEASLSLSKLKAPEF